MYTNKWEFHIRTHERKKIKQQKIYQQDLFKYKQKPKNAVYDFILSDFDFIATNPNELLKLVVNVSF